MTRYVCGAVTPAPEKRCVAGSPVDLMMAEVLTMETTARVTEWVSQADVIVWAGGPEAVRGKGFNRRVGSWVLEEPARGELKPFLEPRGFDYGRDVFVREEDNGFRFSQ